MTSDTSLTPQHPLKGRCDSKSSTRSTSRKPRKGALGTPWIPSKIKYLYTSSRGANVIKYDWIQESPAREKNLALLLQSSPPNSQITLCMIGVDGYSVNLENKTSRVFEAFCKYTYWPFHWRNGRVVGKMLLSIEIYRSAWSSFRKALDLGRFKGDTRENKKPLS